MRTERLDSEGLDCVEVESTAKPPLTQLGRLQTQSYKLLTRALARGLRTPQYLILFVSDTCWMKCSHCWYNERWKAARPSAPPLSTEELSRLAGSIDRLTFLSLTGGEAFMRPDIVAVVRAFAEKSGLGRYQIPTSGFDPELIATRAEQMLLEMPHIPFRVDVSLDGTAVVHDSIRSVAGAHTRAVDTLERLRDLKRRYQHFDVGVITTVSRMNQDEVESIAAMVAQVNPDGEWIVNLTRGEPRDPTAKDVDLGRYIAAHELIQARIKSGGYSGHRGHLAASWLSAKNATRRKVIRRIVEGHAVGGGCAAGALGGVIYSDGSVRACEMLDEPLGDLREYNYDLSALWNARRADDVRSWIQDARCQCTQECFLSISLLIQPQRWPDILWERLRLARSARRG